MLHSLSAIGRCAATDASFTHCSSRPPTLALSCDGWEGKCKKRGVWNTGRWFSGTLHVSKPRPTLRAEGARPTHPQRVVHLHTLG